MEKNDINKFLSNIFTKQIEGKKKIGGPSPVKALHFEREITTIKKVLDESDSGEDEDQWYLDDENDYEEEEEEQEEENSDEGEEEDESFDVV